MEDQKEVWNRLASRWTHWRSQPENFTIKFANQWKQGKILDVGCGNGRNLVPFAKNGFESYGIDFGEEMIKEAKKFVKKQDVAVELKVADARELPFKDETFDYCISTAALHHIETNEGREKALSEINRVLKREGFAFISVWNRLQFRFLFRPSDTFEPWNTKEETVYRYYHLFNYWEFKNLLEKTGFRIMWSSGILGRNIEFVVKK